MTQKIATEWVDDYQFNHILRLVVYLMQAFTFKVAQPVAVIKLQFQGVPNKQINLEEFF